MRKTVKGEKQFTASVWIITKTKPKKVLLVHHKKFNMWIQPGGHIERFENPVEAAIREAKEETGVDIGFIKSFSKQTKDKVTKFLTIPKFFLEQKIAAHGQEPEHLHLDIQYVVGVEKEQVLKHSVRESHGIGWFTKKEALELPTHEDTRIIIQKIM